MEYDKLLDAIDKARDKFRRELDGILAQRVQTLKRTERAILANGASPRKAVKFTKDHPHWTQTPKGRAIMRKRMLTMRRKGRLG